jgi:DNA-directed RNA polymerase specialized sigma24 family protein
VNAPKPKRKSAPKNKTRQKLLSLSPADNANLGLEIEHWVNVEYKEAIAGYLKKFGPSFERKLGMDKDDVVAEIREQIWKGLATYNPSKGANKRTYLNNIIKNRMGVLLKRCSITKYNSIDYFADVFSTTGVAREYLETDETPESIYAHRELLVKVNFRLNAFDRIINSDLLEGRSLEEMEQLHGRPRSEIIGSIKRIDALKRELNK